MDVESEDLYGSADDENVTDDRVLLLNNELQDDHSSDAESHDACNAENNECEDSTDLSLDEVFQRTGYFGWFQIRFLFMKLIFEFVAVFNILSITFVGLSPEWTCSAECECAMTNETNNSKCNLYEDHDANCTPLYTDRFYSIAQEVMYRSTS